MNADKENPVSAYGLFAIVLAVDLLTPFLIWKGVLPGFTRWISYAGIVAMMFGVYVRMMAFDRIPIGAGGILGIAVLGSTVALFRDQSMLATAWGGWLLFQFPLVGLYTYLQPEWPRRFPVHLRILCVSILSMEAVVQIAQYLTGQQPGDNLAGTFGWHGTSDLVLLILFTLCLALGYWLAHGKWVTLAWVFVLGGVSSALGEMKLFAVATLALGLLAAIVAIGQGGEQRQRLVPYAMLMGGVVLAFGVAYNVVVPEAQRTALQSYLEPKTLNKYLYYAEVKQIQGEYFYDLGRNYALVRGWDAINGDATTLLFGMGLGAQSESRTIGIAGEGLRHDRNVATNTSLLVLLQELGLLGLAAFAAFVLWVVAVLIKDIGRDVGSDAAEIRYALLLFSLLWPLWLWYSTTWISRVPMLLYWTALGYALSEAGSRRVRRGRLHLPAQQKEVAR